MAIELFPIVITLITSILGVYYIVTNKDVFSKKGVEKSSVKLNGQFNLKDEVHQLENLVNDNIICLSNITKQLIDQKKEFHQLSLNSKKLEKRLYLDNEIKDLKALITDLNFNIESLKRNRLYPITTPRLSSPQSNIDNSDIIAKYIFSSPQKKLLTTPYNPSAAAMRIFQELEGRGKISDKKSGHRRNKPGNTTDSPSISKS